VLVQVAVLGRRGQGDPLLAHEYPAADIFAAHLDGTTLVRPHQKAKHLIERHKAKISRKSHLDHSLN
jgi:hypothetical protein